MCFVSTHFAMLAFLFASLYAAALSSVVSEWEITPEEFSCYFTRYFHITSPGQYLSGMYMSPQVCRSGM